MFSAVYPEVKGLDDEIRSLMKVRTKQEEARYQLLLRRKELKQEDKRKRERYAASLQDRPPPAWTIFFTKPVDDARPQPAHPLKKTMEYSEANSQGRTVNESGKALIKCPFFIQGLRIKHAADGEENCLRRLINYLEAALDFMRSAHELALKGNSKSEEMFSEVSNYISHFSEHLMVEENRKKSTTIVKLAVLSLWCQSVICMSQYEINAFRAQAYYKRLDEYSKIPSVHALLHRKESRHGSSMKDTTDCEVSTHSTVPNAKRKKLNGPLLNDEDQRVPPNFVSTLYKQSSVMSYVHRAMCHWTEAETILSSYEVKGFFKKLDLQMGPLSHDSSVDKLTSYARKALELMKRS